MLRRDLLKYLAALSTATLVVPQTLLATNNSVFNKIAKLNITSSCELEQIYTLGLVAFAYEEPQPITTTVLIEYKNGSTYEFVGEHKTWVLKKTSEEFTILDVELFDNSVVIHTTYGQCVVEKKIDYENM
jgi:hypothetical protein